MAVTGGDCHARCGLGSVLALRALGLGDFLTGVPAYRALRRAFPSYELVLAAPEGLAPLVPLAGAIGRVLPVAELGPVPWRGSPPDVAVNLHGRGPQSHRLLRGLSPRRLIAFGGTGPSWRADEHEVQRWCRLLAESGIPADPRDLDLARPDEAAPAPGAVVVHPGAASGSRRWPPRRFAAVAGALRRRGHRVVVTGSPAERGVALSMAESAGLPEDDVLAGRTGLSLLAAQVAAARLVVSGDTGIAHLASGYRRPSVVLFGPVPPARWGPPPRPQHVSLWKGSVSGDPHGAEPDPALLGTTEGEVMEAAERALNAADASRT